MSLRQSPSKLRGRPAREACSGPSYDWDDGTTRLRCRCGAHGIYVLPSWRSIRLAELLKLGMLTGKALEEARR